MIQSREVISRPGAALRVTVLKLTREGRRALSLNLAPEPDTRSPTEQASRSK